MTDIERDMIKGMTSILNEAMAAENLVIQF